MATNFTALNISQSGNGYDTASPKSLQSCYGFSAVKDVPSGPSINRSASEHSPLPIADSTLGPSSPESQLNSQKENAPPPVQPGSGEYRAKDWRALFGAVSKMGYAFRMQRPCSFISQ
jgi:hypothetical protein